MNPIFGSLAFRRPAPVYGSPVRFAGHPIRPGGVASVAAFDPVTARHRLAGITRLAARPHRHFTPTLLVEKRGPVRAFSEKYFGREIDPLEMAQQLTEGIQGVGIVRFSFDLKKGYFEMTCLDRRRRSIATMHLSISRDEGSGSWYVHNYFIRVDPRQRQGGIGTLLFARMVLFFHRLGDFSHMRFLASGFGTLAWSRLGGLEVDEVYLRSIQKALRRFRDGFSLPISDSVISRARDLKRIRSIILGKDPPAAFVEDVRGYIEDDDERLGWPELARRARRVGDLALIRSGYRATIDLRPRSRGIREFIASLPVLGIERNDTASTHP